MPAIDLEGLVAIVTGGSRGIGRAIARALAEAGASVVITASRPSRELEETVTLLGAVADPARLMAMEADVTDEASCLEVRDRALERFGGLHVLVNNAGRGHKLIHDANPGQPMDFWTANSEAWRLIVDTNINGPFYMAKACTPRFLQQDYGRIINIGATTNTMTKARNSPYGLSKAAMESETESWSRDLAETGKNVTCNTLAPGGATLTGMAYGEGAAGKGLLDPAIMGPAAVFLASEASSGFNGRRFIARHWDSALDPMEAARKALAPGVFQPEPSR